MSLTSNPIVRSVTKDTLVNSPLLNRMGVQVFRTIAAKALYKLKPSRIDPSVRDYVKELQTKGVIVIKDFLPDDVFENVRKECIAALEEETNPDNILRRDATKVKIIGLNDCNPEQFENTLKFYQSPLIKNVFQAVEKSPYSPSACTWRAEHVVQGPSDEKDRDAFLHSDTFYNTHKAWLYLTDVEEKDGPLVFVRRSHKTSLKKLREIYSRSIKPEVYSQRVEQDEMDRLGFKEEIIVCPKNTLVIANTCGYHRRFKGQPGGQRYALHLSMRSQPFLFWKN